MLYEDNGFLDCGTDGANLRQEAKTYAEKRNKCFEESREAYTANDHVAARDLADIGKDYGRRMKIANENAAIAILQYRNAGRAYVMMMFFFVSVFVIIVLCHFILYTKVTVITI